jgi:hypothetical protein
MCAGVVGPVVHVEAAGQREMTGEESSLQDDHDRHNQR